MRPSPSARVRCARSWRHNCRRMTDEPRIGVVTEPFASRPLTDVMDWLVRAAPGVTDLELGAGGYAPTTHCETALLLRDASARKAWFAEITSRGLRVAAL